MLKSSKILLFVAILFSTFVFSPVKADSSILAETLRQYFKPMKLLPAIVPSTYDVGDVYEFPTLQLISRSKSCFSDLETRSLNVSLAQGISKSNWFAELQAKLKSIVGLGGSGESSTRYTIRFTDAVVIEAARADLLSSLSGECSHLRNLLSGGGVRRNPLQLPIAKTLIARIELFITNSFEVDVEAEVDGLQSVFGVKVNPLLLDAKASAKAGWGKQTGWLLKSELPVAVAFMPAVVPIKTLSSQGERMVPMNPENPLHAGALGELSDEMSKHIERDFTSNQ